MSKYCKEIEDRICALIENDTYTIAEICAMTGISERTYYRWQESKQKFAQAIRDAIHRRDFLLIQEARKSLRKKINGFTVSEIKTTYESGSDGQESIKNKVVAEKYYAPDTSAILFTLTNKDPENWKSKQTTEISAEKDTSITISVVDTTTKAELEKLANNLREDI